MDILIDVNMDHVYMQEALHLAATARRRASPNPGVGCVIVKDGVIIGRGATLAPGKNHAEIEAIEQAIAQGHSVENATLYVTLEPCSHYGRTPPCALRLIDEKIKRVVLALQDPYHEVAGRGIALLRAHNIEVEAGVLAVEAAKEHAGFLSRVERKRPYITLKLASSLDGKSALQNGLSQWITSAESRQDVHRLRASSDAIITGSKTVLLDNPQLNVRGVDDAIQPLRVVLDTHLQTDTNAKIYDTNENQTILMTNEQNHAKLSILKQKGVICEYVALNDTGHLDLSMACEMLGTKGINHLMIEAGSTLAGAFLMSGLVDRIVHYQAPCFLGGEARNLLDGLNLLNLDDKYVFEIESIERIGPDIKTILLNTRH